MLEEIYYAIQKEEIVLPEERTGLVKELYSWKVLLGKAAAPQSSFIHAPTGCYDNELFTIIWGPTIAALSFVFDKSQDSVIVQKAITGFRKCAMISAHYGLSEVFDNIIISLCKFTTFLNTSESSDLIAVSFAANHKAQLAAKTVFSLAHRHGDMLREGWKNILDCMITLYRARLLPATFTEVEDFLNPDGKIKLVKENKPSDPRNDSGVFNAFFTYFSADSAAQKTQPVEEQQAKETSKQELIKALITLCQVDELENGDCPDEDTVVFFLELLIRVILQNRDRAGAIWQSVRDHLSSIIMHATDHTFLAERAVIGLLRIAIRLLCREEVACQLLTLLLHHNAMTCLSDLHYYYITMLCIVSVTYTTTTPQCYDMSQLLTLLLHHNAMTCLSDLHYYYITSYDMSQ
ncbi:GBF1 [Bugula neritina]|uniref:GBF1 n=1 Tax=Bugula neritina TaxID=10212 RepID=A0A7J7KN14_BUGNE|nr:GBF1 [Bugula neritina]